MTRHPLAGLTATWLGHATVVLDLGGTRIVTDPVLRRRVGPLRRIGPEPDPRAYAGAHVALISHLHHDHADLPSLRRLGAPVVLSGDSNARWLTARLGGAGRGLAPGEWTTIDGGSGATVEVMLVRADHHSRPMPHRPNAAHGFLIRGDFGVCWFAGDTALFPELASLPELAGGPIDVALVPIGGWGPRLSPGHLDPSGAARACAAVGARAVLPIHFGTYYPAGLGLRSLSWAIAPLAAFADALAAASPHTVLLRPIRPAHLGAD